MDGILANAGAAKGATKDGGDRRGESCQSQTEKPVQNTGFFNLTLTSAADTAEKTIFLTLSLSEFKFIYI